MNEMLRMRAVAGAALALMSVAASAAAQAPAVAARSPEVVMRVAIGPVVPNAPYSADGITTVTHTLADGTHIEQTTTAKMYRDSAGRERREQTIVGLAALGAANPPEPLVTITDSVAGMSYTLDPKMRTVRQLRIPPLADRTIRVFATMRQTANGSTVVFSGPPVVDPPPPPPPPAPGALTMTAGGMTPADILNAVPRSGAVAVQMLGSKTIDGLTATGSLTKSTIAVGAIGNDRPIEITDEQWVSTELKVLVLSKHHDPRTGDVEYRLTNVVRGEPGADLFVVPSDYTVVETPGGGVAAPALPRKP